MKKKELQRQIATLQAQVGELQKSINELESKLLWATARVTIPYYVPTYGDSSCPAGGAHDYDNPWHGVTAPPCKKCGMQADMLRITYMTTDTTIVS